MMKRYMKLACLCLLLFLLSCFKEAPVFYHLPDYKAYNNLPDGYTLKDAKNDGCIVIEDNILTSGADVLRLFTELEKNQKAGTARIAVQLPESKLSILDLNFDGKYYTLTNYSVLEAERPSKLYKYLKHYIQALPAESGYSQIEFYVLVNDEEATLDSFLRSLASSTLEAYIDCYLVILLLKP